MNESKHFAHIQFSNIDKRFGKGKHAKTILENINIELNSGECTLISGENGTGKSTLLRIMAGLLEPDAGLVKTGLEVLSWKKSRKIIRQQLMYLYQEPYMFDGTVRQNLKYALNDKKAQHKILQALEWSGLEEHAKVQAKCLSGGQKQRVALAQAWLKQPSILLLDEPTANMDEHSREQTEELLKSFQESGTALVIASHDTHHFERIMDKRLLLKNSKLIEVIVSEKLSFDDKANLNENVAIFPNRKNK